jgi:hypothetical protein
MKSMRLPRKDYDAPSDQARASSAAFEESDNWYHNRYGAEEAVANSPLETRRERDIRYHDRIFHD